MTVMCVTSKSMGLRFQGPVVTKIPTNRQATNQVLKLSQGYVQAAQPCCFTARPSMLQMSSSEKHQVQKDMQSLMVLSTSEDSET